MIMQINKDGDFADLYEMLQFVLRFYYRNHRLSAIKRYVGSNRKKPMFPKKSKRMNILEHSVLETIITYDCIPFFSKLGLDTDRIVSLPIPHDDHEGAPGHTDVCATEKHFMKMKARVGFEDKEAHAIEWAIKNFGYHFDLAFGYGWYKKTIYEYKNKTTEEAKWVWFIDKIIQYWEGKHEVLLNNPFFSEVTSNGKQKLIEFALQNGWKDVLTAPNTPKILRVFDWEHATTDVEAPKVKRFFHPGLQTGYPVYDGFTRLLFKYYKEAYVYDLLIPTYAKHKLNNTWDRTTPSR